MNRSETISLEARCLLWAAAWFVVIAAFAIPMPGVLVFFWMFPAGMFEAVLDPESYHRSLSFTPSAPMMIGWMIYAAFGALALCQNRRTRYWFIYGLFCVLLILNVTGCYHGLNHLHFE
jgi:hypothetical protein